MGFNRFLEALRIVAVTNPEIRNLLEVYDRLPFNENDFPNYNSTVFDTIKWPKPHYNQIVNKELREMVKDAVEKSEAYFTSPEAAEQVRKDIEAKDWLSRFLGETKPPLEGFSKCSCCKQYFSVGSSHFCPGPSTQNTSYYNFSETLKE